MRARTIVLLTLLLLPVLIYLGFSGYALWQTGWLTTLGWALPVLWGLTWLVSVLWRETPEAVAPLAGRVAAPEHWTERDRQAVQLIEAARQQAGSYTIEELTDPHRFLNAALELARTLAGHYQRGNADPWSGITILEALSAVRLAVEDTEQWIRDTVPGSKLLTLGQWRMLSRAPEWVSQGQNAYWAASILLNPLAIVKYAVSRYALAPVISEVQREVVLTIYLKFLNQVGFYLIEMYSGRLKDGAALYRQHFSAGGRQFAPGDRPALAALQPESVTIALIGQVKSGKSSLLNALLREPVAPTSVLPETREVVGYPYRIPETSEQLLLLDTPGYAESGASAAQQAAIQAAVQRADVVLLVLAATTPGKAADEQLLHQLATYYQQHPELHAPPIVAVITQIDLLSPVREWQPPYDWQNGTSAKSVSIRGAVEYVRQVFGERLAAIVPVCTAAEPARRWGVHEVLVPELLGQLPAGRAAALLKAYHSYLEQGQLQRVLRQLQASGATLLSWWIEDRLLPLVKSSTPTSRPDQP